MRTTLIILIAVVVLIMLPIWLLAPPLKFEKREDQGYYQAAKSLSEPALAGSIAFGNRCAGCHGTMAQGGGDAPSLLGRTYATDFRDAPAFHAAVGSTILAHKQVMQTAKEGGGLDFNELELMAKFLREMRKVRAREQSNW